ncbi:hypothetical protein AVEN_16037-1 [Araneus ventricosus]|uniref:Uncharacterized protein n=1 Tax=Araneus ventricosus TaxID=182803 RepID=A0A4Y2Q4F6_ARAVE|nr:hypothetical protein AVEN_16037-1 [Araneus ventricosus]
MSNILAPPGLHSLANRFYSTLPYILIDLVSLLFFVIKLFSYMSDTATPFLAQFGQIWLLDHKTNTTNLPPFRNADRGGLPSSVTPLTKTKYAKKILYIQNETSDRPQLD